MTCSARLILYCNYAASFKKGDGSGAWRKHLFLPDDIVCIVTAVPARPSGKIECWHEIYLHNKHDLRYKDQLVTKMWINNR